MNYELLFGKLNNMDCMEGMKQFPDKYFELAIVDPPYGIERFKKPAGKTRFNSSKMFQESGILWDKKPDKKYFNELKRISKYQIIFGMNNFELPTTEYFIVWDKMATVKNFSRCELAWTNKKQPSLLFQYAWSGLSDGI